MMYLQLTILTVGLYVKAVITHYKINCFYDLTSIASVVRPSWLQNAYLHLLFLVGDFDQ